MQLSPKHFDERLEAFLTSWPLSRVVKMTLEEYADLSNHDSFCYWLEFGSKYLGAIGNNPLTKFGIWQPKNWKEFGKSIKFDDQYAWYRTKGKSSQEAFDIIKSAVLEVVKLSLNKKWDQIEKVNLHKMVKWKIAFLYSEKQLIPIYSKPALLAIAAGLGETFTNDSDTYLIQQYILGHREIGEHIDDFAHRVYTNFAEQPNYYLVGSKYITSQNDTVDIFPEMLKSECIAIGYLWGHSFENIKNAESQEINAFVKQHRSKNEPIVSKVQSQVKHFLRLKQGDIVAIKSKGQFNKLEIVAYARVIAKESEIYKYDPGNLGHTTHVEFLETGFTKFLGFNYADSIHRIKPNSEHFKSIFGKYALLAEEEDDIRSSLSSDIGSLKESIPEKSEYEYERKSVSSIVVRQIHSQIQNRFIKFLSDNSNGTLVSEFKGRIDVVMEQQDVIWFYEIKPFENAYKCIRESIGQLLDYTNRFSSSKEIRIATVGPNEPNDDTNAFISHIKKELNLKYSYIAFDFERSLIKEF